MQTWLVISIILSIFVVFFYTAEFIKNKHITKRKDRDSAVDIDIKKGD